MFYKQTITDIELVILTLDGGLLDLNRLRYNYFKRLCQKQTIDIPMDQYVDQLGCYKTMYDAFGLDYKEMDTLIENDLFSYVNLKPEIVKEGVEELLQFCKQRKIKVAVISSHKTRQAIGYLQLTNLYDFVDFIVGGDTDFELFPSDEVLEDITRQMEVSKKKTLVVANYPSVLKAANEAKMNVIYVQDLIEVESRRSNVAFDVVKNYLELINLFLFSKYDDIEIYSKVLGMSKDMDLATLESTYRQLLIEYQNDEQLLDIVKRSYKYYLLEISAENTNAKKSEAKLNNTITTGRLAAFEDFEDSIPFENASIDIEQKDDNIQSIEDVIPDISPLLPESFSKNAAELGEMVNLINNQRESVIASRKAEVSKIEDTIPDLPKKRIPKGGIEWTNLDIKREMKTPEVVEVDSEAIPTPALVEEPVVEVKVEPVIDATPKKDIKLLKRNKILEKEVELDRHEGTSLDFSFIRKAKKEELSNTQVDVSSSVNSNDDVHKINPEATDIKVPVNPVIKEPIKMEEPIKSSKLKKIRIKEDKVKKEKNPEDAFNFFDYLYSLFVSFVVVILSMFGYICFKDFLSTTSFISNLISNSCGIYIMFGEFILSTIFNLLNTVIPAVPSYEVLMLGNDVISGLGILVIWFTFIGSIFGILIKKGVKYLITQIKLELKDSKTNS